MENPIPSFFHTYPVSGVSYHFNPYMPRVFCRTLANSTDQDQLPRPAASDQSLDCLLTESFIKI